MLVEDKIVVGCFGVRSMELGGGGNEGGMIHKSAWMFYSTLHKGIFLMTTSMTAVRKLEFHRNRTRIVLSVPIFQVTKPGANERADRECFGGG